MSEDNPGPDLYQRACDLLVELRHMSPAERERELTRWRDEDPELHAELSSLLEHGALGGDDDALRDLVREQAAELMTELEPSLPDRIGRYRVLRSLGEGGTGHVYAAEQDDPRRTIALKVLRSGLASREAWRRFRNEARVLARLRHPGIAHVHEAGILDDPAGGAGLPYIVMELVEGLSLIEHATTRDLSRADRIRLLIATCDAVSHAHENGIVHRDLKPANILVDATGQPRVLDFGAARATRSDQAWTTLQTHVGQVLGTLVYMSPEQARGDVELIDERTDVHALGVLAFELLSGRLPHDVRNKPLPEAARMINEGEPLRLGQLDHSLRGDLEAIVAKALEREPSDRYPSVAALRHDLAEHLAGRPVTARSPTALQRSARFARRHWVVTLAVGAVIASLGIGLALALVSARDERRQRERAERTSYRAAMSAASLALQAGDVGTARRQLDESPPSYRGWEWHHLHARLDESTASGPAPANSTHLAVSPRGDRLLTWSPSGDGHLIRLPELTVMMRWPHDGEGGCSFAFSTDGRSVSRACWDGVVSRHDATTGEEVERSAPVTPAPSRLFSRDGRKVLVRRRHHHVLLDPLTGERLSEPTWNQSGADLALSPDGSTVAYAWTDYQEVRLLRAGTSEQLGLLHGHSFGIDRVTWAPDGSALLTAARDRTVRHWDPVARRASSFGVSPGHGDRPSALAVNLDTQRMASAGQDGAIRISSLVTGTVSSSLLGHAGAVHDLAWSKSDGALWSLGSSELRRWDAERPGVRGVLGRHDRYAYSVVEGPEPGQLTSAGWDGLVRTWDGTTGRELARFRPAEDPDEVVVHAGFTPGGRRWALLGDGSCVAWDAAGVILARTEDSPDHLEPLAAAPWGNPLLWEGDHASPIAPGRARGQAGMVLLAAWHPDRQRHAFFASNGEVLIADRKGVVQRRLTPTTARRGYALRFDPSGRRLAVTRKDDTTIVLWDVETGTMTQRLSGHARPALCVAWSPDGRRLASGAHDRTIRLWDPATGDELVVLRGHESYVHGLTWSADGDTLVSASGDGTVRTWTTGR
ncbi:MAG: protein kinase [Acidobacteriota bacterium]